MFVAATKTITKPSVISVFSVSLCSLLFSQPAVTIGETKDNGECQ
jgi:hypothetical protein